MGKHLLKDSTDRSRIEDAWKGSTSDRSKMLCPSRDCWVETHQKSAMAGDPDREMLRWYRIRLCVIMSKTINYSTNTYNLWDFKTIQPSCQYVRIYSSVEMAKNYNLIFQL